MMADIEKVMLQYPVGKKVKVSYDGHIEFHTVKRYVIDVPDIYIDMEDGLRFHIKRLQEMEVSEDYTDTVVSILTDVTRDLCDHYCKYPGVCATDEELHDRCAECPITRRFGVV